MELCSTLDYMTIVRNRTALFFEMTHEEEREMGKV